MQLYEGEKCPVCQQIFKAGDDVVVCPECGTPHHRQCYKETGHCINENKHAEKFEWKKSNQPIVEKGVPKIVCPRCGEENIATNLTCSACGTELRAVRRPQHNIYQPDIGQESSSTPKNQEPPVIPFEQVANANQEPLTGIVTAQEIYLFVGKNTHYFDRVFKRMYGPEKLSGLNWAALLFNFSYFFYRKMYKIGILFLLFILLCMAPTFLLMYKLMPQLIEILPAAMEDMNILSTFTPAFEGYEMLVKLSNVGYYAMLASGLVAGFTANRFYYRHVVTRIRKIRLDFVQTMDLRAYSNELYRRGGTNIFAAVGIVLIVMVGWFWIVNFMQSAFM